MTLLGCRTIGFVMLRDLRRWDQSTSPPATAIIMFPTAQLMFVVDVTGGQENIEKRNIVMLQRCKSNEPALYAHALLSCPGPHLGWR